jgi:hypothetical protein
MINLVTLQENLEKLSDNFSKKSFIFDLLSIYELPKSTISLLSKNPLKLSGKEDQIILKNKVLFHITTLEEDEHVAIDTLQKDKSSYKYNPRFIIVTDFVTFLAIDTKTKETLDINIKDLGRHYAFFLPWCGMEKSQHVNENPADIRAAYKMDKLYQVIVNDDPEYYKNNSHDLNIFLSRLLFCFFAEDTAIFPKAGMFTNSIISHTHENGDEMDVYFSTLFDILNTKDNDRSKFASHLLEFPYVNGGLFENKIKLPTFTVSSRKLIIECGKLNWDSINPDIFGSMIQAVVHPGQRENLGMHYTSVPNIMKVIEPLFLNNLYEELENSKTDIKKLTKLRERVAKIKIFDPACGSGNFLIIAYKELCKLEIEIIKLLNLQDSFASQEGWNSSLSGITLNNFYGIEIDDFAHEIARLSLYLAQHQINIKFEEEFGKLKPTLPLKESGKIVCGNATRLDWNDVCPRIDKITGEYEIYVIGNPPYLGQRNQEDQHKADLALVFSDDKSGKYKKMDYVCCWFMKGAEYISRTKARLAYVSTNSVTQGVQIEQLWPRLFSKGVEIKYAFRPFKWKNSAKDVAGVFVVVISLANTTDKIQKYIYDGSLRIPAKNINPYLIDGDNIIVEKAKVSLNGFHKMLGGCQPREGGYLMLDNSEKNELIKKDTRVEKFILPMVGSIEFLNRTPKWCIWIEDDDLEEAQNIPVLKDRIEKVKQHRINGNSVERTFAGVPWKFVTTKRPKKNQIIIPAVTTSARKYIPIGFLDRSTIVNSRAYCLFDSELYYFSILSSMMHNIWVKAVSGRLGDAINYSSNICYNTFPFPNITPKQKESLTSHVYNILEEREKYPEKTMADLYDPDKMPDGLREAHKYLDLAIDQIYRSKPFEGDEDRLAHLFKLYEEMITKETNK